MKRISAYIILLFLFMALVNCSSKAIALPDVGFPIDGFNTDLEVSLSGTWNTFSVGNDVTALVTLNSEKEVIAPLDFNLQLYIYDKEKKVWNKIENNCGYFGEKPKLNAKNSDTVFSFCPLINKTINKPVTIFFLIYGYEIVNNNTTENKIGAYQIFTLNP